MSWVTLAVGVGSAAYSIYSGKHKEAQAKKQAASFAASRPKLPPSQLNKDALSLAESELSVGQDGKIQQAYQESTDRDFSSSLSAILRGGGSPNDINSLFGNKQAGDLHYTMLTDNLRLGKIDRLVRAQQMNQEQDEQAFQFNNWAPWSDNAQANAASKADAANSVSQGINTLGSAAIGAGKTLSDDARYDKYFKTGV